MPDKTATLMPVFALAAWTMIVLLVLAYRRFSTALDQHISPREFALGESDQVPVTARQANRNLINLLELPVLFYVACLIAYETGAGSRWVVGLAWAYVALRVVHSLIHLTHNRVMRRFAAFAASNLVLVALWVLLGIGVFGGRA